MIFISFQSCAQIEAKDGGNVEEEEQGKLQELAIKKIYLK